MRNARLRKTLIIVGIVLVILAGLFFGFKYWDESRRVTTVYVEGNQHYTAQEIEDIVMSGRWGQNSYFLSLKYKDREIKDVPFVDVMSVQVLSPNTIKIIVYEKALAGYISYLDTYMYFDKDGFVIECSDKTTDGVPLITGLNFDHVVYGEQLPVEDPEVFERILSLTKLIKKYDLKADRLYFYGDEVTMYCDAVRVELGTSTSGLEDKFMLLPEFLERLEGQSGVLGMSKNINESTTFTFKKDVE